MSTKRLRELAKAATPGPWMFEVRDDDRVGGNCGLVGSESDGRIAKITLSIPGRGAANTAYIAAISPDVLLALLDRLEELEESVREYRSNQFERGERD